MTTQPPALTIDGLIIPVTPDPVHEYTLGTAEVAAGYGVTDATIRRHKKDHADELIEGKHFSSVSNTHAGNLQRVTTVWTKRGIIRLGFFIKSARAKRFRDLAEDLVLRNLSAPAPSLDATFTGELLKSQAAISEAIAGLARCFNRFQELTDRRLEQIEQRLGALEQPRLALATEDRDEDPAEAALNSDMLRLVAHLRKLVERHGWNHHELPGITFTANEIITTAAKLRCFPQILKGRFCADGTFNATPSARSSLGKLLSDRYRRTGFILDDGKAVYLCHTRRGRARRYYLDGSN